MNPLVKLKALPSQPKDDITHWADYVELLCLVRSDRVFSSSEVVDWFKEMCRDVPETEEELSDDTNAMAEDEPALADDMWATRVGDIFRLLAYRSSLYGTLYPFRLLENGRELARKQRLTEPQRLYVFLLLCSSLRLLQRGIRNKFTSGFELLSVDALKKVMPREAEIHLFGGANTIQKGDNRIRYKGSLYQKICQLAQDLHTVQQIEASDLPATSNQDGGLDIVGWIPTGDALPGLPIFFGQCACSPKDWRAKAASSSYDNWKGKIKFHAAPSNNVFIPHCMRTALGNWHQGHNIYYMLFDRKRLLHIITNRFSNLAARLPMSIVNAVLDLKLSTFE